jgi:hypothetical protein
MLVSPTWPRIGRGHPTTIRVRSLLPRTPGCDGFADSRPSRSLLPAGFSPTWLVARRLTHVTTVCQRAPLTTGTAYDRKDAAPLATSAANPGGVVTRACIPLPRAVAPAISWSAVRTRVRPDGATGTAWAAAASPGGRHPCCGSTAARSGTFWNVREVCRVGGACGHASQCGRLRRPVVGLRPRLPGRLQQRRPDGSRLWWPAYRRPHARR